MAAKKKRARTRAAKRPKTKRRPAKRKATKRKAVKRRRTSSSRASLRLAWERAHAREMRAVARLPVKATAQQLRAARAAADATNKARRRYLQTR